MNRYSPVAAVLVLFSVLYSLLLPTDGTSAYAHDTVMVPEGGRLDAMDAEGNILGPCPLNHTDVNVDITGHFARVTLTQQFKNPYEDKIEAVYSFPMSHRAAVDRMIMTIGQRVVLGEVHEREEARAIYEAARRQGYVASLLEQERPNIFTQSVANIEPGAEVDIEISYVELLESKDGTYNFEFPMVVGPRYIPGAQPTPTGDLPVGLTRRNGLILLGPASFSVADAGDVSQLGTLQTGKLATLLHNAVPILFAQGFCGIPTRFPVHEGEDQTPESRRKAGQTVDPSDPAQYPLWYRFQVTYCDKSKEFGELYTNGTGQLNGRWFYIDPKKIKEMGTGFSLDTNQVPDASRITPEPVKPGKRAGHDISVRVVIDTGGPGIVGLNSALHEIVSTESLKRNDGKPRKTTLSLAQAGEIPNRDFVLNWRLTAETIEEATFMHTGKHGKFFTLILAPPDRVEDTNAVARELIFVLDTSGSMKGFPIEKAKAVMAKAIDALRPQDTFNLITFAGATHVLWGNPQPFTEGNRAVAQQFLATRQGRGGTEMMKAIEAALVQTPDGKPRPMTLKELTSLPADGRAVRVTFDRSGVGKIDPLVRGPHGGQVIPLSKWWRQISIRARLAANYQPLIEGTWITEDSRRVLAIDRRSNANEEGSHPMRIVCFMTDGLVGNDMAIIDAVKKNSHTTRVFSFGIGNSFNRYLLDSMARAGRGEVEYVLLNDGADEKADRFARRIQTPVLTDIELEFSDNLEITDTLPTRILDLFDTKPIIIHGRYARPGQGTLTVQGNTGAGRYERVLEIDLPETQPAHDTIATLWARAKVKEIMEKDLGAAQQGSFPHELKLKVIGLGEQFQIMTQFTSFVAVERAKVTIGGQPRLVAVPIEMPDGVSYEGVFGPTSADGKEMVFDEVSENVLDSNGQIGAYHGRPDLNCKARGDRTLALGFSSHRFRLGETGNTPRRKLGRASRPMGGLHAGVPANGPATPQPASQKYSYAQSEESDERRSTSIEYSLEIGGTPNPSGESENLGLGGGGGGFGGGEDASQTASTTQPASDAASDDAARWTGRLANLKARNQLEPARQNLISERAALRIAQLVEDGKIEEARPLADALSKFDQEFKIGAQMRDVLADDSLDTAERDRRIADLGSEAKKPTDEATRQAKIRRRLDPKLYDYSTGDETMPAPYGFTVKDGGVLVSILVSAIDDTMIAALQHAGLNVEASVGSMNFVVGTAPRNQLHDIALVDGVRKIEPTKMQ